MSEPKDDARSSAMERGATAMPRGTDGNTANYHTRFTEHMEGLTPQRTPAGRVTSAIARNTPARSSRLSDEERQELLRLRTIRKKGWMLSMTECDWLLEILERVP
jgi:hypothetical protein